ncbi:MAG TPA: hypothetical protein VMT00_00770 [Thermoanaerobaculia bacterium]|nr:hypothetical protein [Thermoanaerobaculia bacterium]
MKTLCALLLGILAVSVSAAELTFQTSYAPDHWLRQNESFHIALSRPLEPSDGRLAVFFDQTDVTSLFSAAAQRLTYEAATLPLPSGEHELVIYLISPEGAWNEVARFPMRVLSRRGLTRASVTPSLDLAGKGQLDESHSPEDNAPSRDNFQDATLQAAIRSDHESPAWALRSESQITGVSFQNEALRFGEKGNAAPRIDLGSYRVDYQRGSTLFSVGHLSFGASRYLVSGFGSRGVAVTFGHEKPISLQLAALNGSSIVGWDNFLGLNNSSHQVFGATLGFELIRSRPGGLRLETTVFEGSLQPFSAFNQGAVLSAEKSDGVGIRLLASDRTQRLRVEAGYTGSKFREASDPQLELDLDVVPLEERSRGAMYLDATLALLQNRAISEKTQLSLTLGVRHEQLEPLFRSVGASAQADIQNDAADLTLSLGPFNAQLGHARSRDNLDDIESILTTKTRRTALSVGVPMAALFGVEGARATFLPMLSIQLDRTHQFGVGIPVNAEFAETHVPDQMSDNGTASLDWQIGRVRAGLRIGRTKQDNRQVGRENADFETSTSAVSFGFNPVPRLGFGIEMSVDDNESLEVGRRDRNERYGTNVTWTLFGQTALTASASKSLAHDNFRTSDSDSLDGFLELSSGFRLSRGEPQRRQGRVFLRYGDQRSKTRDLTFGTDTDREGATVTSGLTLSLF